MLLSYCTGDPPIGVDIPIDEALTYFPNTDSGFFCKLIAKNTAKRNGITHVRFSKPAIPSYGFAGL